MEVINLTVNIESAARSLADYAIGFGELKLNGNIEDGTLFGSGTLVTVGKLVGIVTARHVAEILLKMKARPDSRAHIVRMPHRGGGCVQHELDLKQTEFVLSPGQDGPNGPDLAFVLLSVENAATLKATSSFYPLIGRPLPKGRFISIDVTLGIVAEWTTAPVITADGARRNFTLLSFSGQSEDEREHEGYDLATLVPPPESDIELPKSYGGVSGGGVWRVLFKPDGSNAVVERRLIGTAFYELPTIGRTAIVHHGPRSLETRLLPMIRERWPSAFAAEPIG